jgi:hypothetical protein
MPDIDTLFIIGLVIASIIGNLSKKKGKQSVKKDKVRGRKIEADQNPSLEDVLKEAWANLKKPQERTKNDAQETEPIIPVSLPQERVQEKEKKGFKDEKALPYSRNKELSKNHYKIVEEKGKFPTIKSDLFSNKASLKKAFILKEILDQPVSMRKSSL